MPIFGAKSVKFTPAKKNLHGYIRGIRDKYQVCEGPENGMFNVYMCGAGKGEPENRCASG